MPGAHAAARQESQETFQIDVGRQHRIIIRSQAAVKTQGQKARRQDGRPSSMSFMRADAPLQAPPNRRPVLALQRRNGRGEAQASVGHSCRDAALDS